MLRNIAAAAGRSVIADAVRPSPIPEDPKNRSREAEPRDTDEHESDSEKGTRPSGNRPARSGAGPVVSSPTSHHRR